MFFIKNATFRVQAALSDKMTTDFARSRKCLHDSDLSKAKQQNDILGVTQTTPEKLKFFGGPVDFPMDMGGFLARGFTLFLNFTRLGSRNDFVG